MIAAITRLRLWRNLLLLGPRLLNARRRRSRLLDTWLLDARGLGPGALRLTHDRTAADSRRVGLSATEHYVVHPAAT